MIRSQFIMEDTYLDELELAKRYDDLDRLSSDSEEEEEEEEELKDNDPEENE